MLLAPASTANSEMVQPAVPLAVLDPAFCAQAPVRADAACRHAGEVPPNCKCAEGTAAAQAGAVAATAAQAAFPLHPRPPAMQLVLKAQENLASLSGDSFTVTGEDGRVWYK